MERGVNGIFSITFRLRNGAPIEIEVSMTADLDLYQSLTRVRESLNQRHYPWAVDRHKVCGGPVGIQIFWSSPPFDQ